LPKKWKILHQLKIHKVTARPFVAPLVFKVVVEVVVLLLLAMVVVVVVVVVVLLQAVVVVVVVVVVPAAAMVLAKRQVKVNHVEEVAPDSALQKWNLCLKPLRA
jgi:hypothetical protein